MRVKARYKNREGEQAAQCTLLLSSSLNILKHRKHFVSKYDALICKWICPHTYITTIRDGSLRFAMRVSTEDAKMNGRCNVKASARYACRLRRVASRATTLHLTRNIPRMILNRHLFYVITVLPFADRFLFGILYFGKFRGEFARISDKSHAHFALLIPISSFI